MLNSRKGNLSCFQWEVERFQQSHREKMAAISPHQTYTKPTAAQQQQHRKPGGLRKRIARETLAEIEVRKRNALMVERMTEIHRVGGFQRRCLHEFQDIQTALQFGKTNVGVLRMAHEHRFIRRKKIQELVRRDNAKLIARLASPKRSGIDFSKFEADFAKSREHRRLAQGNHTVGHTSVLQTFKTRAPCSGTDSTACHPTPSRQRQPPNKGHEREHPSRMLRQRTLPAGQRSDSSPTLGGRTLPSGAGSRARSGASRNSRRADESPGVAPSRPRTSGGCRRPTPTERPHTALGLRRGSDHRDLFDARAADPGWGGGGTSRAHLRPPSAPERRREGADFSAGVRHRRPPSARHASGDGGVLPGARRSRRPETGKRAGRRNGHATNDGEDGGDVSGEIAGSSDGGAPEEFHTEEEGGGSTGGRSWCLGRTLLVEAKVLINSQKNDERQTSRHGGWRGGGGGGRGRMKVALKFLSLDGLIRQREGVRKTLRGFVVEASLGKAGSNIASASVAVSAVQAYLENTGLGAAGDGLEPFREARPLDDRGNYQELNALLGRVGQRALYEFLLASCRVVTSGDRGGKVGVQLLRVNAGGAGISATAAAAAAAATSPGTSAHRSKPLDGAVRSAGSSAAPEGVAGVPATSPGVGGGSRATAGRGGDKSSPIVVRIPPATSSGPATSPKSPSEDGSITGGEEEEEEEEEEDDETA